MTIKIFDLEQDQSLLVELEEKDMKKVCGGAGAVDATIQSTNASVENQIKLSESATKAQAEISAAQAKASIDQNLLRNIAETVESIK
jgi:hypothetical protein